MKSVLLSVFLIIIWSPAYGDTPSRYNLYFAGLVKHFNTAPENNDGNMEYLALTRDFNKGDWLFETGVGTYIDSYHTRSYMIFSNVSHERYTYNWFQPMLSLTCTYKGEKLNSDERETICAPLPKIRIGKDKGLFTNVTFIPKFKDLTNGFIGIEFGYKF